METNSLSPEPEIAREEVTAEVDNKQILELYKLPVDDQEGERLSYQHLMWRISMGGLYPTDPGKVHDVLSRAQHGQPGILDLGSGSGIWAVEIAREFPGAKVVGVDLAPRSPKDVPPNCSFVSGDITQGLDQFRDLFDLVHCRSVAEHVNDFSAILPSILECLRPGGLLILEDGEHEHYDAFHEPMASALDSDDVATAAEHNRSWFARVLHVAMQLLQTDSHKPENLTLGRRFRELLHADANFDPSTIEYKAYYVPVGWAGNDLERGEELGEIAKQNCRQLPNAWKPYFLSKGVPFNQVEEWVGKVEEELNGTALKYYCKWHAAWAFKR